MLHNTCLVNHSYLCVLFYHSFEFLAPKRYYGIDPTKLLLAASANLKKAYMSVFIVH